MEKRVQSFDVCIVCALPEEARAFLEVEPEVAQMAQLTAAPVIALQRDWKAWEATFDDVSVCYVRMNPSEGYGYLARGTNKKEPCPFWYASPRDIGDLCKKLVEWYGRQDAVSSSEWAVKEIFPFLI